MMCRSASCLGKKAAVHRWRDANSHVMRSWPSSGPQPASLLLPPYFFVASVNPLFAFSFPPS